jgi:membrane protein implicated in regulation of membrane protease activity
VANGDWRAADVQKIGERGVALFLLLIIVAIALGIVGVVVKGLFYLLIIGVVVLIADLVVLGARMSRRRSRPGR